MKSSTILLQRSTSSPVRWSFCDPPFSMAISAFNSITSFLSLEIITPGSTLSFRFMSFWISYTLRAKRQVPSDSWISSSRADTVAIILVLQLPPSESRRIMVIIEFLNGTWVEPSPWAFLLRFMMTNYSWKRDPLMYIASVTVFWSLLSVPGLKTRSEPERSTRWSLDTVLTSEFRR